MKCTSCEYWLSPRGFQRPSDYAATHKKITEWVKLNKLNIIDSYNFQTETPSETEWPSDYVSAELECVDCKQKYNLKLDVEACRGGFKIAP